MENTTKTQGKELIGTVSSAKMEKTVAVEVTTLKRHPLYHKRYRSTKRYLSDTGSLSPQTGDMVRIVSSRPLSKLKRWVVTEILQSPTLVTEAKAAKGKTAAKPVRKSGKKA